MSAAAPELNDLAAVLQTGRDTEPVRRRQLVVAAGLLRAALVRLAGGVASLSDTVATLSADLAATKASAVTLTVVANAAALPATAGPRQLFRVVGDGGLYMGNGPNQPLTKLVPVPLV